MYRGFMQRPLRSLVFVLLTLAFASDAAAQASTESAPIRFSVAGGLNISRLSFPLPVGDDLPIEGIDLDNSSRVGVVAGGLVDFRVAPGIGVLTGGLMSTRGGTLKLDFSDIPDFELPPPGIELPDGPLEIDLRMIYVDVPAFVTVGLARSGDHRFEAIGGGMIGLKTSARMKVSFAGFSQEEGFSDELPAVDFGLSAGGRYSCGPVFAAAYYTWGLTDIGEGGPDSIKHRYLTIIGGWRF